MPGSTLFPYTTLFRSPLRFNRSGFFMETTYRVYVIENSSGQFYIRLNSGLGRRLEQLNSVISSWTRNRGPWKLAWQSVEMSLGEARKLENRLKRQKGGKGFSQLTGLRESSGS